MEEGDEESSDYDDERTFGKEYKNKKTEIAATEHDGGVWQASADDAVVSEITSDVHVSKWSGEC